MQALRGRPLGFRRRVLRRGFGAIFDDASGLDEARSVIAQIVFGARAGLQRAHEFASKARDAQKPQDLAWVAEQAEKERDAERASSRGYAAEIAGTAGTIGGALIVYGGAYGVVAGLVVIGVAAAAYAAYEGVLKFVDLVEKDYDAEEYQTAAASEIRWFVEHGFPFPQFDRARHGHVAHYVDNLRANRQSIEAMPPEDVRAALFAAGRSFLAAMDDEIVVQAAFVVGGERGRDWPHAGYLSSASSTIAPSVVSDRDALEFLIAAVGVTVAREYNLPATHVQACIDAADRGWSDGVKRGKDSSYGHPGSVGLGYARIYAEDGARRMRAALDEVATLSPGAVSVLYGARYEGFTVAPVAGGVMGRLSTLGPSPTADDRPDPLAARDIDPALAQASKPPPPAEKPSAAGAVVVAVAATGVGLFLFKTAAGLALRKAIGL